MRKNSCSSSCLKGKGSTLWTWNFCDSSGRFSFTIDGFNGSVDALLRIVEFFCKQQAGESIFGYLIDEKLNAFKWKEQSNARIEIFLSTSLMPIYIHFIFWSLPASPCTTQRNAQRTNIGILSEVGGRASSTDYLRDQPLPARIYSPCSEQRVFASLFIVLVLEVQRVLKKNRCTRSCSWSEPIPGGGFSTVLYS